MGLSAVFYACVGAGSPAVRGLMAVLGGLWALRLFLHLLHRIRTEDEDGRYQYLRQHWQDNQAKFFGFFQAQALFTAIFSLPFLAVAANHDDGMAARMIVGALVWLGSLYGESVADRQLARFRHGPAARLACQPTLASAHLPLLALHHAAALLDDVKGVPGVPTRDHRLPGPRLHAGKGGAEGQALLRRQRRQQGHLRHGDGGRARGMGKYML